jgi:hypothetical protein
MPQPQVTKNNTALLYCCLYRRSIRATFLETLVFDSKLFLGSVVAIAMVFKGCVPVGPEPNFRGTIGWGNIYQIVVGDNCERLGVEIERQVG